MTKAKQLLISEERKIRVKANRKQYEADRLYKEADEIKDSLKEMD